MKWGMHLGGVQGLIPEKEGEGRLGGWELKDCESSEGEGIWKASRTGTEAWGRQAEPEERGRCRQELSRQCWVVSGTGR